MTTSTFDPEIATRDELTRYYTEEMGLRMPPTIRDETLRSRIAEHIEKIAAPEPILVPRKMKDFPKYRVIIAEDKHGPNPVQIGINGTIFAVKRGVEVHLPEPYLKVLEQAVQTLYDPKTMETRHVHAYPFQVLGKVE